MKFSTKRLFDRKSNLTKRGDQTSFWPNVSVLYFPKEQNGQQNILAKKIESKEQIHIWAEENSGNEPVT